jgi:HK97 family phage portal protein
MTLKDRLSQIVRGTPLPIPRKSSSEGMFSQLIPQPEIDLHPIKTREQKLEAFSGWVYAATTAIMTDVGQETWQIVRKRGQRQEDFEAISSDQIPGQFKRPNSFMTFQDVVELTVLHLDLAGEAFWHIITADNPLVGVGEGEALGIQIIYPHWIEEPVVQDGHLVGWRINIPNTASGGSQILPTQDVIFFRYPHPKEPLCGASPVEAFAMSHELDLQSRGYGAGLLKNNAIPPILISTEQDLDPKSADQIAERWKDRHLQRPGEPAVLGKGSKAQLLGLTLNQIGLDVIDKMTRQQVFGSYGVPESKKGLVEDVNRANAEANERTYQRNVIRPRLRKIQWGINMFLMPRIPRVKDHEFRFDSPVDEDKDFILDKTLKMIEKGMITINQGLQMLGEDEQEDGDVFLVPSNVERIPAGLLSAAPPPDRSLPPVVRGHLVERTERVGDVETTEKWSHIMEDPAFELAEVRFLRNQERLERRMLSLMRGLISRQQKIVVRAFLDNQDALLGPRKDWFQFVDESKDFSIPMETRDAIDDAVDKENEDWITEITLLAILAIETGHVLFADAVDIAVPFDLIRDKAERFAATQARLQVANINATTKAQIRRVIALGIEAGQSPEIIAGQIRKQFDVIKGARAATIARTEMAAALNHGALESAKETRTRTQEEITKTWITILDGKCREAHCNTHGQVQPVDQNFEVNGFSMNRPHDPNAPAEMTVNCRCTMAFKKRRR